MSNNTSNAKRAAKFLANCYFGDLSNPILAAIDKAYIDMATHTIETNAEISIFARRKKGTEALYKQIKKVDSNIKFNEWHKDTTDILCGECNPLTCGQAQKWINMTVKYLVTLFELGIENIPDCFSFVNQNMFHAPLDSYVLNELNETDCRWSKIDEYIRYMDIEEKITFSEEYDNWYEYVLKSKIKRNGELKAPDANTYARYIWENKYNF